MKILTSIFGLCLGLAGFLISQERPNIVFFFTDDHAPQAIGAYDGWLKEVNPTPEIDKLAADGMVFRNSFCTNSICGPSRAVILSGKHSHKNGFMENGNTFDWNQQIFPKLLQKAGYETALYGKTHLKGKPQGFDDWKILPGQGDYYNPQMITPEGNVTMEGYCTDVVTDLAIEWLKEGRAGDKPFLLMVQHKAPHRCWMPGPDHLNTYDDIDIPEPPTLFDQWEDNAPGARHQELEIDRSMHLNLDLFYKLRKEDDYSGALTDRSAWMNMQRMTDTQLEKFYAAYEDEDAALKEANLQGDDLVRWKYQRYVKNYLRCVRGVDDNVGRLRGVLEEMGLAENTIFVYSSDQGFYIGEHGWYDKRWMYEESFKMPLIVSWPGVIKPGSETDLMVQNLDYAQTFLEAAGVEQPEDMQGASLVSLMKGEEPEDWREAVYYHYYEYPSVHQVPRHNGIRTERYKLIQFYEFGEWEFYDLQEDPDELTNLFGNSEYETKIAEMKEELEALRVRYDDQTVGVEKDDVWKTERRANRLVVPADL